MSNTSNWVNTWWPPTEGEDLPERAPRVIDQRDNGFIYPEISVGAVLGAANPNGTRMDGEVGDEVLWTTSAGVVRGEVIGVDVLEGGIPATLVKVTAMPQNGVVES